MNPSLTAEMLVAHGEWLGRLAAYLLRDGAEAEDAVQETWEAALRSPPDPARPYVHGWRRYCATSFAPRVAPRPGEQRGREAPSSTWARLRPMSCSIACACRSGSPTLLTDLEEPYRTTLLLRFYDGRVSGRR
jgi:hypothetical protein